jgi:hypothetical protein
MALIGIKVRVVKLTGTHCGTQQLVPGHRLRSSKVGASASETLNARGRATTATMSERHHLCKWDTFSGV